MNKFTRTNAEHIFLSICKYANFVKLDWHCDVASIADFVQKIDRLVTQCHVISVHCTIVLSESVVVNPSTFPTLPSIICSAFTAKMQENAPSQRKTINRSSSSAEMYRYDGNEGSISDSAAEPNASELKKRRASIGYKMISLVGLSKKSSSTSNLSGGPAGKAVILSFISSSFFSLAPPRTHFLLLHHFFTFFKLGILPNLFLSSSQFASSTCLIGFQPNLVRMTSGWVASCLSTSSTKLITFRSVWGHLESQGSKIRSNYKQLQMTKVTVS